MNTTIQKMNNTIQNTKIDESFLDIIELVSKHPFEAFTIDKIKKLISKQTDKNYATIYRKVESLVNQGILSKSMYGMASQIRIDLNNPKTISILSLIETKKHARFLIKLKGTLFASVNEIIKGTSKLSEFICVIIFGSYAKGRQNKNSDLDILVIYELPSLINLSREQYSKYNEDIRHSIRGVLKTSELRGGPKISPIIISSVEHKGMILNKEINVAKETLLNHLILKGFNEYWREISICRQNAIQS